MVATVNSPGSPSRVIVHYDPYPAPNHMLARGGKELGTDGVVSLLVEEEEDWEGDAAVVVIVAPDGKPRAQAGTVVGS